MNLLQVVFLAFSSAAQAQTDTLYSVYVNPVVTGGFEVIVHGGIEQFPNGETQAVNLFDMPPFTFDVTRNNVSVEDVVFNREPQVLTESGQRFLFTTPDRAIDGVVVTATSANPTRTITGQTDVFDIEPSRTTEATVLDRYPLRYQDGVGASVWITAGKDALTPFVQDFEDFTAFAMSYGKQSFEPGYSVSVDFDQSGVVGFNDLLLFAESYNSVAAKIEGRSVNCSPFHLTLFEISQTPFRISLDSFIAEFNDGTDSTAIASLNEANGVSVIADSDGKHILKVSDCALLQEVIEIYQADNRVKWVSYGFVNRSSDFVIQFLTNEFLARYVEGAEASEIAALNTRFGVTSLSEEIGKGVMLIELDVLTSPLQPDAFRQEYQREPLVEDVFINWISTLGATMTQ